mmetsp:Transcript_14783/g.43342  ORF Transcript_14783/g.43342 Transcript_14783/m.43342 type:complete len:254 (+) Transcript_14783:170-931(+)
MPRAVRSTCMASQFSTPSCVASGHRSACGRLCRWRLRCCRSSHCTRSRLAALGQSASTTKTVPSGRRASESTSGRRSTFAPTAPTSSATATKSGVCPPWRRRWGSARTGTGRRTSSLRRSPAISTQLQPARTSGAKTSSTPRVLPSSAPGSQSRAKTSRTAFTCRRLSISLAPSTWWSSSPGSYSSASRSLPTVSSSFSTGTCASCSSLRRGALCVRSPSSCSRCRSKRCCRASASPWCCSSFRGAWTRRACS